MEIGVHIVPSAMLERHVCLACHVEADVFSVSHPHSDVIGVPKPREFHETPRVTSRPVNCVAYVKVKMYRINKWNLQ